MVQQVEEKGYSLPRRDRILEWQSTQDFQICPNPDETRTPATSTASCSSLTKFMTVFRSTVRRRRKEPSAFGRELSRPGRQREVVGEAAFGAS